ncbi:MAG: peptide chain release factor H [Hyphomicrobiaceae bacterium]
MTRLLLTSGRGPAECRLALAGIARQMVVQAHAAGLDTDIAYGAALDGHGAGSAIIALHGAGADAFAATWVGSAQWIAQSPIRPHHKRKNWFIGIVDLGPRRSPPQPLRPADVRFETFGAGGPGGQHQNKTESAVRAVHGPTGLAVVARNERSQHRNKAACLQRLAALLMAQGEVDAIAEKQVANAAHDQLERGRAVRQFKGPGFKPLTR